MSDPLTGLSVAASIVQLVDVGCRIINGAAEFYRAGNRSELRELALVIQDLRNSNAVLAKLPSYLKSKDESLLRELAATAEELAGQLEKKLLKLQVPDDARFRLVRSARASVESAWQTRDIQALKHRLLDIQELVRQRIQGMSRRLVDS